MKTPGMYMVEKALDYVEANLHDHGTHATAQLVALGVVALGDEASMRSVTRAEAILRAVAGGAR